MENVIKKKQLSEAAKSSIAFAVSSFLVKGINFITTPIFTRIMSSDEYGVLALYNSWLSILEVFALLGLTSAGVFNVGLKEHKEDRKRFISSVLVLCNIVTLLVFAIIFLLKIPFGKDFIISNRLLFIMAITFIFQPAQIFWITSQRYEFKWKAAFFITVLVSVLSQIVAVISLTCIKYESVGFSASDTKIYASSLGAIIIQIPIYIYILVKGRTGFDKNIWKTTLVFALPLLPHYLAQHVMNSSDKIMISSFYSSSGSAIYSVVMNVSVIATIIWTAINASLIPFTFEKLDKNDEKSINSVAIPVVLAYSIMCIGVTIVAPEIIKILAPKEYYEGIYVVPPIAATAFIMALYNLYANIEFYHKKSWWIALSTIVAAAINVVLNYLLIPFFGYVGAAYTTLVSNIVLIIMHYIGHRLSHRKRVYNDFAIFIVLVVTIALCLLCNLLYLNNIIRFLFLELISLVLLFLVKPLRSLLKKIKKQQPSAQNELSLEGKANE